MKLSNGIKASITVVAFAIFNLMLTSRAAFGDIGVEQRDQIVLSSVRLGNGGCSGTVIWKGDDPESISFVLTAWHCVNRVGSNITVHNTDGVKHIGTVYATDRKDDLALVGIFTRHAIEACPPQQFRPDGEATAVGFPKGVGPKFKTVTFIRDAHIRGENGFRGIRSQWSVDTGPFNEGDSGGGVFIDGSIVGVMSHGRGTIMSANHEQIVRFLITNSAVAEQRDCTAWWCQPNISVPSRSDREVRALNETIDEIRREFKKSKEEFDDQLRRQKRDHEDRLYEKERDLKDLKRELDYAINGAPPPPPSPSPGVTSSPGSVVILPGTSAEESFSGKAKAFADEFKARREDLRQGDAALRQVVYNDQPDGSDDLEDDDTAMFEGRDLPAWLVAIGALLTAIYAVRKKP